MEQAPLNGELLKTSGGIDNTLKQGDSFTLKELNEGRVRFAHNAGEGTKSRCFSYMYVSIGKYKIMCIILNLSRNKKNFIDLLYLRVVSTVN